MAPHHDAFTSTPSIPPRDVVLVAVLGLVVASLGGYLCGLAIDAWGGLGAISIWGTGWAAGAVTRKLITPHRLAGMTLVGATVLAAVVAETLWIERNIVGVEHWLDAFMKLPQFARQFSGDVLVAVLLTIFGASSAYRQAGMRYRYVAVMDP